MFIAQKAKILLSPARGDLSQYQINENDTVIGLAASGRTPYVIGGYVMQEKLGLLTGASSLVYKNAESLNCRLSIEAVTGAEAALA